MYQVYALYSPSAKKIYIGFTSNLKERMKSHNEMATKGFTIKFRPWEIAHTETFKTKREAMLRERQLKSAKGREFLWNLIREK